MGKKIFDNLEGYFCVGALAAMSVVVFIQVVCRFVLKSSLPWSEEVSRYLLVWVSFLGGAYGVRQGAHIGVEAFMLLFPKKIQQVVAIFVTIASMLLCAVILKYGIDIVSTQLSKMQVSPAMRMPMGYMYAAIPIGMVFFIIRYFQMLMEQFKDLKAKDTKVGGAE